MFETDTCRKRKAAKYMYITINQKVIIIMN